jgi:phosphoglycolate phosphatase
MTTRFPDKPNRDFQVKPIFMVGDYHSRAAVLFDLDGTLVDSAPDISCCVNRVMDHFGLPIVTEDYVRKWAGPGTRFLLKRLFLECKEFDDCFGTKECFINAYELFMSFYREINGVHSNLYPNVIESLLKLKRLKLPVGIVTNRPAEFTFPIISQLALGDLVDVVVCADQFGSYKPDPSILLHAMSELGGTPEFSVMIGDTLSDVIAAKSAGIMSIYVRYGYQSNVDRCELQADCAIDSLVELV